MSDSQRLLAVLAEHPDLKKLADELEKFREYNLQKLRFMKKQAEEAQKEEDATSRRIWDEIKAILLERQLLPPEYSDSRHRLTVHRDLQILSMSNKKEVGLADILAELLK